ncbi:MAG: hypothetical protein JNM56_37905 [Planctomycetia bacterium]|nr:hypothetical protein [Planctomycetia bacterium]
MWECTSCRLVMRAGLLHRHLRVGCTARRELQAVEGDHWSTGLAAAGVAAVTGVVAYTCLRYW